MMPPKIGLLFALLFSGTAAIDLPVSAQQEIKTSDGDLFMEEVPTKGPKQHAVPVRPLDLSQLGVPVTPSGRIVPLIQNEPGGVMPLGSNLSVYGEMPVWTPYGGTQYLPTPYNAPNPYFPYGYGYGYPNNGIPGPPYYQPSYNGYAPYNSYTPYNGYAPYAVRGLNLHFGRSNLYLGSRGPYGYPPSYAPPLGYAPQMYSSNGMGSYNFSSSQRGGFGPFGNSYSYSSGGMLSPLLGR